MSHRFLIEAPDYTFAIAFKAGANLDKGVHVETFQEFDTSSFLKMLSSRKASRKGRKVVS